MNDIQTQISLLHVDSGLNAASFVRRTAQAAPFTGVSISVGTTAESLALGDVITPKQVFVKLLSGDPLQIGTVFSGVGTGTYPFRLVDVGESTLLRLEVETLVETSTITAVADSFASLAGLHFDIRETGDTLVRVWFDPETGAGVEASGTITSDNTANVANDETVTINAKTYTFKTALSPAEGEVLIGANADASLLNLLRAINHTGTPDVDYKCAAAHPQVSAATAVTDNSFLIESIAVGVAANSYPTTTTAATLSFGNSTLTGGLPATTAPGAGGGRLLPVVIAPNDTADAVAAAIAAALTADSSFTASAVAALVTVVDANSGTRSIIVSGTFTVGRTQIGAASPVVWLKSTGTSQVVVAVTSS